MTLLTFLQDLIKIAGDQGLHIEVPTGGGDRYAFQVTWDAVNAIQYRTGGAGAEHPGGKVNIDRTVLFQFAGSNTDSNTALQAGDLVAFQFGTTGNALLGNKTFGEGLSIGFTAGERVGWHGTTADQHAAIPDIAGGASLGDVITALNLVLEAMREKGQIAT